MDGIQCWYIVLALTLTITDLSDSPQHVIFAIFQAHASMAPIEIKDLVTEQISEVILVPVQESQVPEEGIVDDFDDADSSLEQDISLAPVILANDEENKDFLTSESSQVVQVKVDLQDTSLYQECEVPEGEIVAALENEDSCLEKDISLAQVILLNDEDGAFENSRDILASDSCHLVQVKVDLQDGTSSLLHDYEETSKSDPTLEEV